MITNEEAVKMSQELYDYCNHRHEVGLKGYGKNGQEWACCGCPFACCYHDNHDYHNFYDCKINNPWIWGAYHDKDNTK